MRKLILLFLILFGYLSCASTSNVKPKPKKSVPSPISSARQLVLVVSDSWIDPKGILRYFERENKNAPWKPVNDPVRVDIGKNGMGWGIGLHKFKLIEGPIKKEGDGKSPAGIFTLTKAFGYAPLSKAVFVKLDYIQVKPGMLCIDDPKSAYYNKIILPVNVGTKDWFSFERMWRPDYLYNWGIIIDHNTKKTVPGAGSCIFLHTWDGRHKGTSGCTALPPGEIVKLLYWLDKTKNPVIVQLPKSEYVLLKKNWGLP